jgi:hypothetical protein
VILRNFNQDYLVATVANVAPDSFTTTCVNTGAISGTAGFYTLGFTFAHTGTAPAITGGILTAPIGGNVILLSMRIYLAANTRATTTYNLTVPPGSTNGAGGDTGNDDLNMPILTARLPAGLNAAQSSQGPILNLGANFNIFNFTALPAVGVATNIQLAF